MEENKRLLTEAIANDLEDLKGFAVGTEEREKLVNEIKELYRLQIDEYKVEVDAWDKDELRRITEDKNASEEKMRLEQNKTDVKRSIIESGKAIVVGVGSAVLSNRMMTKLLKFEETGTITSKAFRLIPMIKFW